MGSKDDSGSCPGDDPGMAGTRVRTIRGEEWAVLHLSSRDGLSRLGAGTLESLRVEVERVLTSGCRCLGLSGEGKSFAVGSDLNEMARVTPPSARVLSGLANGLIRILERSPIPVVVGINGFCLGGGLDLALGADWRLASSSSVFGHPGADLGIITGFGGTQRLSRLVGPRRTRGWVFSSARVGAQEAYEAGLIQEICSPAQFPAAFEKRVKFFAGLPSDWIREVKRSLRAP